MLYFLLGTIFGGAFGIFVMCLLQINRDETTALPDTGEDFEKSPATGVDNTVKKA